MILTHNFFAKAKYEIRAVIHIYITVLPFDLWGCRSDPDPLDWSLHLVGTWSLVSRLGQLSGVTDREMGCKWGKHSTIVWK